MIVKELTIERPAYGEDAGRYIGKVSLEGERGKQELKLSSGAIGRIFATIQQEVSETAKSNAKQVAQAVEEATNSTALIGHTIDGLE